MTVKIHRLELRSRVGTVNTVMSLHSQEQLQVLPHAENRRTPMYEEKGGLVDLKLLISSRETVTDAQVLNKARHPIEEKTSQSDRWDPQLLLDDEEHVPLKIGFPVFVPSLQSRAPRASGSISVVEESVPPTSGLRLTKQKLSDPGNVYKEM